MVDHSTSLLLIRHDRLSLLMLLILANSVPAVISDSTLK